MEREQHLNKQTNKQTNGDDPSSFSSAEEVYAKQ